jgi:3-hydroxybutyryl-CoA dehydrogenase
VAHYELIFGLGADTEPDRLRDYAALAGKCIVLGAVLTPLHEMVHRLAEPLQCYLFGLNALPTMLEPTTWETSSWNAADRPLLQAALQPVGIECVWVQDERGMLTPRTLAMILNEAWLMVDEGTATMADIDKAMRLGVNYPYGPFEWSQRLGLGNLLQLLQALQQLNGPEAVPIARGLRQAAAAERQQQLAATQ